MQERWVSLKNYKKCLDLGYVSLCNEQGGPIMRNLGTPDMQFKMHLPEELKADKHTEKAIANDLVNLRRVGIRTGLDLSPDFQRIIQVEIHNAKNRMKSRELIRLLWSRVKSWRPFR